MRVTILGAGALGTIIGAHLSADNHDVTIVARGPRATYLENNGLQVEGLADLHERCRVVTNPTDAETSELLIVAVKTYDNESAIRSMSPSATGTVFSVANGVLKNAELVTHFGISKVLGCMANTSGEILENGRALFTRNVCLHLGHLELQGVESAREISDVLNSAGIVARNEPNIEVIEWSKFVGWVALVTLSITTRLPTGRFLADPGCALIASRIIHEMAALAAARKVEIIDLSPVPVASVAKANLSDGADHLVALGREWVNNAPDHRMSSLQDLNREKRLEVHETLGFAVKEAARLDIPVPTLTTCYELIAGIDSAVCGSTASNTATRDLTQ